MHRRPNPDTHSTVQCNTTHHHNSMQLTRTARDRINLRTATERIPTHADNVDNPTSGWKAPPQPSTIATTE
ncbi:uncharacterized protein BO95DRAFT_206062 [Aspergillus brunneoviolaceus CBS 621.78]|uniref:Uncharacterized protein n=1 Tax=Aspergillus brunneoviolaceus CBS 621.78 TaxID=1450534 RepID=A0ACD1G348_9EURO|nr:hypothetical protein BO95DRAFT_206062 [Aspergillus brunneoviolaceus CBS 621.78]RAH43628.1 hypothetical protein BO95DRAFT_206062 [Aspergillus brunneoviolaceus CBS 621.78]